MVGLITATIFVPLVGALAVCAWPQKNGRPIALMFNAISAICALALWRNFDATAAGLQFVERHIWIPAVGAEYLVGIDGLSLLLVLLTSLIVPFAFLAPPVAGGGLALVAPWLLLRLGCAGGSPRRVFVSGFFSMYCGCS